MAIAAHHEDNMAKWVGVRPGHNGEQVGGYDGVANGDVILYTVPADKILLIFNWSLTANSAAAAVFAFLGIRDALDVQTHALGQLRLKNSMPNSIVGSRYIPYEVPEGYDVYVSSNSADCSAYGTFDGILIDA